MMLAQQLYEEGFITYHRTDSTFLSQQFIDNARSYIKAEHGDAYVPQTPNTFKTNQKNAQEAHEAIRPTSTDALSMQKTKIRSTLDERAADLFELIYKRSISSQMTPAVYENTTIKLISPENPSHSYQFSASGSILVFDGYMKEWGRGNGDTDLPKVEKGEILTISRVESTEHTTTPPPRYNEASLIKALEENGIGRPSTYAPTIDTIQYRNYAYKENSALVPSDTGIAVSHLLTDHFEEIVDLGFTADMENKFDDIANGQAQWQAVIRDFYTPFEKKIELKDEELERKDYKIIKELDEKCPDCEHNLVLKIGKYGKFYSCSNFPDCKYAKPFVEKIDMQCPTCQTGDVIVRRTRFGKIFYGCSHYPDCDWASWTDPRSEGYDPEVEREKQEQRKARAAAREAKKPIVKKAKKTKTAKTKRRKTKKTVSKRKA
jgi:DNA topoisomerase-1